MDKSSDDDDESHDALQSAILFTMRGFNTCPGGMSSRVDIHAVAGYRNGQVPSETESHQSAVPSMDRTEAQEQDESLLQGQRLQMENFLIMIFRLQMIRQIYFRDTMDGSSSTDNNNANSHKIPIAPFEPTTAMRPLRDQNGDHRGDQVVQIVLEDHEYRCLLFQWMKEKVFPWKEMAICAAEGVSKSIALSVDGSSQKESLRGSFLLRVAGRSADFVNVDITPPWEVEIPWAVFVLDEETNAIVL